MALAALQPSGLPWEAWPAGGQPAQALSCEGGCRGAELLTSCPSTGHWTSLRAGSRAIRAEVADI